MEPLKLFDGFTKLRMARKNNKSKTTTKSNNNLITYLLVSYALTQESRTTEKAKKLRRHGCMNELKLQLLLQSFELTKNKIKIT